MFQPPLKEISKYASVLMWYIIVTLNDLKITTFLFQLIIFMALANGKSQIKCRDITMHTKTAIYIAEQFTNVS